MIEINPTRLSRVHVVTVRMNRAGYYELILSDGSSVAWNVWVNTSLREELRNA